MLYSLLGVVLASRAEEEAAMMRMLTLQQRSLVSDRPLPVVPLPGAASATGSPPQQLNGSCAAADLGYPTSISTWAARFAAQEYANAFAPLAAELSLARPFDATMQALHDGHFAAARERLNGLCMHAQALARAMRGETEPQQPGPPTGKVSRTRSFKVNGSTPACMRVTRWRSWVHRLPMPRAPTRWHAVSCERVGRGCRG